MNLSFGFENKLLPNDLIIVRNHGDDEEETGEEFGDLVETELEAQSKSSSSLSRSPGAVCTEIDAQVAYGLGFGHSRYVRKANKKVFPMSLV